MRITVKTWPGGTKPTQDDATLALDIDVSVVPQLDVVMLEDDSDFYVKAILIYSLAEGCYIPREVTVGMSSIVTKEDMQDVLHGERNPTEAPVSGSVLRQVKVAELVKYGAVGGIFVHVKGFDRAGSFRDWWGPSGRPEWTRLDLKRLDTQEDALWHVGLIYMVAVMSGDSPAQAVEREFGLAKRTAANWIARAKAGGFIRIPGIRANSG